MIRLVFDTNVLLDYFGVARDSENTRYVVELVTELAKRDIPFVVTPHVMKDFAYILSAALKSDIREEYGAVSDTQALAVQELTSAALDSVLDVGTIASEDLTACEMARLLCKQHHEYEDNLVAAVAMRIDATCIVTRDKKFARNCPVKCCTPEEALGYLRNGIWD